MMSRAAFARVPRCLLLMVFVSQAAGCNRPSAKSQTAAVQGTVTYRSQPVTSGVVSFYNPRTARQAQGFLDARGMFEVATIG